MEMLARTVLGWILDNIRWDGWEKQRSYLKKVFDFVTGKKGILEKRERK